MAIIIQENIKGNIKKFDETEKEVALLIKEIMLNLADKRPFNITFM